jgi:hypothetical protein
VIGPSHFAGAVGMRSRASRRRLSDNDIRCSASDRRWFPARPAQHVHRRCNHGKAEYHRYSRAWQKRQKRRRDVQRRTRRNTSTIGGAAPDTIIGRAAADRAGARPYRASSPRCSLYDPRRGSNPRRLCLTNAYFGGKTSGSALYL